MVVDGRSFMVRALRFVTELKAGRYPNAASLAKLVGCSHNTAQRVIERLRDEHFVPMEYDPGNRGYLLTDKNFQLPQDLPPGRDEFTALVLARDIIAGLEALDVEKQLDALWLRFASKNDSVGHALAPIAEVFSSDATVVADLADWGMLDYVEAARAGEDVELRYKSPWKHTEEKTYLGRILRVHYSDSSLYLLFLETSGRDVILNASFVKGFRCVKEGLSWPTSGPAASSTQATHWLEGFGVWAGSEPLEIEVHIAPPGAEFYAAQRWHAQQKDSWEGPVLVRRFPGIVSPELERRLLSLGPHLKWVSPASLRESVKEKLSVMLGRLS
jgi:hypothetical protein